MHPEMAKDLQSSKFRVRTIGIAAENKDLSSKYLEVFPIEITPFTDGELTANQETLVHTGKDATGTAYTVKVGISTTVIAKWLQLGSNRDTAPDVRRGEKVMVYQFADDDKYYWESTNLGDNLRRLETVRYVFSGSKDETIKAFDATNSYYFEISTHNGKVTLSTSKANGEPFGYVLQLDTLAGNLLFSDDAGNFIQMNSQEQSISAQNTVGSYFNMIKDSFYAMVTGLYQVEAGQFKVVAQTDLSLNSQTYENNATTSMTETSPMRQANVDATINTGTWDNKLSMLVETTLNVTALATVGALASGPGGTSMSVQAGAMTITVPINSTAELTTTAPITSTAPISTTADLTVAGVATVGALSLG